MSGISKSSASKPCKGIGERAGALLARPPVGAWPHLRLDATHLQACGSGRTVSVAAMIAVAANTEGRRGIIGLHLGPFEAEPFRTAFLRDLSKRGLAGVKPVIPDARERWPKPGVLPDEAKRDVLACIGFPVQHRAELHGTNPLERLDKEVKRRADIVGIFPDEDSITRLVGAVLMEANDERRLRHRCTRIEGTAEPAAPAVEPQPLLAGAEAA